MTNTRMSLEDVFNDVMLQEAKPNPEALLRWQQRYPQYRRELAHFFNTWAVQLIQEEYPQEVAIDEDMLAARTVSYAMDLLRRQDQPDPKPVAESLTPYDEIVLTAVYLLHGLGEDMEVADKVSSMLGKEALLGSIFVSLSRLERNGLISPWHSDPTTEADGTSKRYFKVTLAGERALSTAKATSRVVADALGEFA